MIPQLRQSLLNKIAFAENANPLERQFFVSILKRVFTKSLKIDCQSQTSFLIFTAWAWHILSNTDYIQESKNTATCATHLVALVFRVNGHGGIPQHGLNTGRCHHQFLPGIPINHRVCERYENTKLDLLVVAGNSEHCPACQFLLVDLRKENSRLCIEAIKKYIKKGLEAENLYHCQVSCKRSLKFYWFEVQGFHHTGSKTDTT